MTDGTIKKLWADNCERQGDDTVEYSEKKREALGYREVLCETLSKEQKCLLDKYENAWGRISASDEQKSFVKGFKLGIRLLMESMGDDL